MQTPMKIAIASGKGGTGKTTVAVNLALSVSASGSAPTTVQLLDCDVEAPNCHLFLRPALNEPRVVYTPVPQVDLSRCTYCRQCADFCQFRALAVFGENLMVFSELCHSCGGCMRVCPEEAIGEVGREIGFVQEGRRGSLQFAQGRLRIGEAMAPPLIQAVRKLAGAADLTIIDAPPGTSCPVIAAVRGVDAVLLVTEPTPFGRHDLELAVATFNTLGLPQALVINRADVGDAGVRDYAHATNLPILMEIPYDRRIAEVYARGGIVVDDLPEYQPRFAQLFIDLQQLVKGSPCRQP